MPRARTIKYGFFRNELLAEVSVAARLVFVGLWTLVDRAGRMADNPKRIKMLLMPCDAVDCEALLVELAERGFVIRYEAAGQRYLQVVNFETHQNPHPNEEASEIPPPAGYAPTPKKTRADKTREAGARGPSSSAHEKSPENHEGSASDHALSLSSLSPPPSMSPSHSSGDEYRSLPDGPEPVDSATAMQLLAHFRIQCRAGDPRVALLVEQRVSRAVVKAACIRTRQAKPAGDVSVAYVVKVIERWKEEAGRIDVRGASPPAAAREAFAAELTGAVRDRPPIIDVN